MATVQQHPPSSFHGTSLISRRCANWQLNLPCSPITCSSPQSHWTSCSFSPCAPIDEQHIVSLLTSSLQMQSPQGEALLAMTNERTPLVQIRQAAAQQLNTLAADVADCRRSRKREDVLQRRIADIKEGEIHKVLQDITLALVTHRLVHATLAVPDQDGSNVALNERLQAIHPPLVQPLVDAHVALVINGKGGAQLPFEPRRRTRVCTLEMGKLYAASVMHGYFLARVYQRFKLERLLQLEAVSIEPLDEVGVNGPKRMQTKEVVSMEAYLESQAWKDTQTLSYLNTVRWSHTLDLIEHHCQALFGVHKHPLQTSSILNIQLAFVKTLILQALAFGATLWDVESNFITPRYPFHQDAWQHHVNI